MSDRRLKKAAFATAAVAAPRTKFDRDMDRVKEILEEDPRRMSDQLRRLAAPSSPEREGQ